MYFFLLQRGLAQTFVLSSVLCFRNFTRGFAKKYGSPGGIPLAEKVNERPGTLEERVQILETLLEEYYLDASYLKLVKDFIDQNKGMMKELKVQDFPQFWGGVLLNGVQEAAGSNPVAPT